MRPIKWRFMATVTKKFDCFEKAITFIEELAYKNNDIIVFRGQNKDYHSAKEDGLQTPFARLYKTPLEPFMAGYPIDSIILNFRYGLAKIDQMPFDNDDRKSWMEYARHYGAPVPCIDFTHSPYIALFFAFSGINGNSFEEHYAVIYALNVTSFAMAWVKGECSLYKEKDIFAKKYQSFLYNKDIFSNGFPTDNLQFIPELSKWNKRMQRQQGVFFYDTLNYKLRNKLGLEHLISELKEFEGMKAPILHKIYIKANKCIRPVFEKLELMNVTGSALLNDPHGIVMDIYNQYHYKTRNWLPHDIQLSQAQEK